MRFLGPAGEPEVRLLDLAELHLPDSKDAKSLDAQCITAVFKRNLDLFDDRRGKWLHGGPGGTPSSILLRSVHSSVLAKILRMLPLILADLDMRANEMFIDVLFTPEEKTFQYRVTSITTGGFKAKPALTKHGLE